MKPRKESATAHVHARIVRCDYSKTFQVTSDMDRKQQSRKEKENMLSTFLLFKKKKDLTTAMNYICGVGTFSVDTSKQFNHVITDRRKWGTAVATCICSPVHLSRRCQATSSKTPKHLPPIHTSAVTHDFACATVLTDAFAHQHGRRTTSQLGCEDDYVLLSKVQI